MVSRGPYFFNQKYFLKEERNQRNKQNKRRKSELNNRNKIQKVFLRNKNTLWDYFSHKIKKYFSGLWKDTINIKLCLIVQIYKDLEEVRLPNTNFLIFCLQFKCDRHFMIILNNHRVHALKNVQLGESSHWDDLVIICSVCVIRGVL